jgi:hypothetical protein
MSTEAERAEAVQRTNRETLQALALNDAYRAKAIQQGAPGLRAVAERFEAMSHGQRRRIGFKLWQLYGRT